MFFESGLPPLPPPITYTAAEIATIVQGEVLGDGTISLTGLASANAAGAGELTFAEKEPQFLVAEQGGAAAILAPAPLASPGKVVIRVKNARIAFAKVLPLFHPAATYLPGCDSSAIEIPVAWKSARNTVP